MSVLLVYLEEPELLALELAASDAGVTVERASNGLYAERRLGTWRPDLIVCAERLEDMPGTQLHAFVRRQPHLADCAFVLLGRGGAGITASSRDLNLDARTPTADLWRQLAAHAGETLPAPQAATPSAPHKGPTGAGTLPNVTGAQLRGTLTAFGAFELVTSLQQTRKNGQLTLHLGEMDADFFLRDGEVVHAEYLGLYGEEAFLRAFEVAERTPDATFTFEAQPPAALNGLPRTVHRTTERVMLELAVKLDHARAERPE